jgi:hypothetical protein
MPVDCVIIVGGTGGSGTRLIREILQAFGIPAGTRTNESGDAIDFIAFYEGFISPTLRHTKTLNYSLRDLPNSIVAPSLSALGDALSLFRQDLPEQCDLSAIKNPRSMYALPYFQAIVPQFYFLHVVRDGRDIALSSNQNQVLKYYEDMFGEPLPPDLPVSSARLWARANADAADWCEVHLRDRYKVIRYEDVCRNPHLSMTELADWLGLSPPGKDLPDSTLAIRSRLEIGRWRALPEERVTLISAACSSALKRFHYL